MLNGNNLIHTTITAHSGCDDTPMNSLESVLSGINDRADIIEVDVRADKNGRLILSHNLDQERIYAGHAELIQVLEIFQTNKNICLNCDIKETEIIPSVLESAEQYQLSKDRIYLSGSVTPELLRQRPEIIEKCDIQWNIEEAMIPLVEKKLIAERKEYLRETLHTNPWEVLRDEVPDPDRYLPDLIKMAKDFSLTTFNMPLEYATDDRIRFFHNNGLKVSVWTVNDGEEIYRLLRLRVRNITTKKVKMAIKIKMDFLGFIEQEGRQKGDNRKNEFPEP